MRNCDENKSTKKENHLGIQSCYKNGTLQKTLLSKQGERTDQERVLIHRYITWFQEDYSELHKDMAVCNHNYDTQNLNPYHLESDCWSHTMMVCKIAEMSGYGKTV